MQNITIDVTGVDTTTASALAVGFEAIVAKLREGGGRQESTLVHGWNAELVLEFDSRLRARNGGNQAAVIRAMVADDGRTVDRAEVVEVCGFGPDRLLVGFTKPVKGVLRSMSAAGLLPAGADDDKSESNPLRPDYAHGPGKATGFFMDTGLAALFAATLDEG